MSGLKIAHITTIDMTLRYILLNQLHDLQRHGYHVTTIASPGENAAFLRERGLPHIQVPMSRRMAPAADLRSLFRLYRVIKSEKFALVHTHTPKAGLLGQLAARLAGVPIIVNTIHGFYFHENMGSVKRALYITTEKLAARCSSLIFSVNQEDIKTAHREGIGAPEKIKLLGPGGIGIDVQRFNRETISETTLAAKRAELGLSREARIIGFVGRLVLEKGIQELLQAVTLIKDRLPNLRVLIIGPIDSEKADALTPAIAAQYGLEVECVFTGMRQDIPELMALMDVFVLPSHREGFPVSLMQASAMRLPCVVTDIRGCREAVKHGQNGLLVPFRDVQALADAILNVLSDPQKAYQMGEAGRRMALECFDEQLVFEHVRAEYARLLRVAGLPIPHETQSVQLFWKTPS